MMVFSSAVAASMHWLNHFIVAVHILNEEYIHYGFLLFFLALLIVIIPSFQPLFLRRFARSHRWLGLFHLIWLCFGFYLLCIHPFLYNRLSMLLQAVIWIMYDAVLGISGTALTLSASRDFSYHTKDRVKSVASGTLEQEATVTSDEMVEHSFYQMLNLVQAMYLHVLAFLPSSTSVLLRLLLLFLVTTPWMLRANFPVHHFSANYSNKTGTTLYDVLYRLKKYQYVFYKFFLLHGLNVTIALFYHNHHFAEAHSDSIFLPSFPISFAFRLYWLSLNTAYVMEFFLQTLVKRRFLQQSVMLWMNKFLMLLSTMAAIPIISIISIKWSLIGLFLGFYANDLLRICAVPRSMQTIYRQYARDVINVMVVALLAVWCEKTPRIEE